MTTNRSLLPAHGRVDEPNLAFHTTRPGDRDIHPLRGLLSYGPYSRSLFSTVADPIRVATISTNDLTNAVSELIHQLEKSHKPKEQVEYTPHYRPFNDTFGIRVVQAEPHALLTLPTEIDTKIQESEAPHLALGEAIHQAVLTLGAYRADFDILLILLPTRWSAAFRGPVGDSFDLHDYIKAVCAVSGIPTQVVNEDGGLNYPCRANVMWSLSIAIYTKAGGIPWMAEHHTSGKAFIGLSYSIQPGSSGQGTFVNCCSQVFDADGSGMEFLGYEARDVQIIRDNPFLSRTDMFRLISRSVDLYSRRHAGRLPSSLVIHKTTEFKPEEIEGCFDAWKRSEGLELVQIQQESRWRGIRIDAPGLGARVGSAANFPMDRGVFQPLGDFETLLWTQGNVRNIVHGRNYYKESRSIPSPVLIRRFAGHGGWEGTCSQVLSLTKMNWNNHSLYDRLPVTLTYAQRLARVLSRIPQISSRPYQFRFFM